MKVSALFVQANGIYSRMDGVDPWPEERDARTYAGPFPVVAHPPCASWGRYAKPTSESKALGPLRGDDGGCFASALASVRAWGGVIEHPAHSDAWKAFGLLPPNSFPDQWGGRTVEINQRDFGHEAIKPTWLYVVGCWPLPPKPVDLVLPPLRPLENLGKVQRAATPAALAEWLLSVAKSSAKEYK